jgi:hypothetical protein
VYVGPYQVGGGAAQFAEGLDEEDAFAWWTYESEDAGNDSPPIGLRESIEHIQRTADSAQGPIVGVVRRRARTL